jgi:hypothetical protein
VPTGCIMQPGGLHVGNPVLDVTALDCQPKYDPQGVEIINKKHFK